MKTRPRSRNPALPIELLPRFSLRAHNTLGLDAVSRFAVEVGDETTLTAALADSRVADLPRLVLGGGSNIVFTRDFDGVTLLMRIGGRRRVDEQPDAWIVEAGAGEPWHEFVAWTLAQGWAGLENLALIPGTAGAAPIQNIGAYGLEMVERCAYVRAFDTCSGGFVTLTPDACRFAYRDSVFKHEPDRYLVTAVGFRLPRPWRPVTTYADVANELAGRGIAEPSARDIFDAVVAIRRRKLPDPQVTGNAGSFFKNPVVSADVYARLHARHPGLPGYVQPDGGVKLAAGWLIDRCGWKGKSMGRAGVHERQALVLVNRGGATGQEILALARAIIDSVRQTFGVTLAPEPIIL